MLDINMFVCNSSNIVGFKWNACIIKGVYKVLKIQMDGL